MQEQMHGKKKTRGKSNGINKMKELKVRIGLDASVTNERVIIQKNGSKAGKSKRSKTKGSKTKGSKGNESKGRVYHKKCIKWSCDKNIV